jgi:hypothetical protein
VAKTPAIRKLVVLSDLHCGSTVGLLPPGFVTLEGNEVRQNLIQRWLWACWTDAAQWARDFVGSDPWALVLNGDAVEGVHHGGKDIVSTDAADHVAAAEQCLALFKPTASYLVEGTECHVGSREHSLGKSLGARPRTLDNGKLSYVWPELLLDVNGVLCSINHHISPSSRVYLEGSGLSIAMGNEQLECVRAGHPVPRVICRAHRHRRGEYSDGSSTICVTGAWQALTRHGRKVVTGAVPKPSILGLHFDGEPGKLPVVSAKLYTPPAREAQLL